jgi:hypothetical protein
MVKNMTKTLFRLLKAARFQIDWRKQRLNFLDDCAGTSFYIISSSSATGYFPPASFKIVWRFDSFHF